jgi:hypothetical protein
VNRQPTPPNQPLPMSKAYHHNDAAFAESKVESRMKIAKSIQSNGKHHKVIHYLGGQSQETPFENYFPILRTEFVRYEKEECPTPNHYVEADWRDGGLVEKPLNKHGYFCNGNFFDEVENFMEIFCDKRNYFWLDFCGMPKEDLVNAVYNTFFHSDSIIDAEEIYLTFFLNPRGIKFVSDIMNRYGSSLDARALSVCDSLRERFSVDNYQFSVFDVYLNGNSPMGVIKINKQ